MLSLDNKIMK